MAQVPVTKCQYCGSEDIGEGWQHGEALVRSISSVGNAVLYCTSVWLNPTASRPQNSIRSLYL